MKKNEIVLVTGGTGYIATYIIAQLLKKGYSVRTTIRSLKREKEVRAALAELGQTTDEELQFFEAELTKDTGWAEAVANVTYVFHVASPLPSSMPKDENELIIPAKEGTLRVLRAAKNAGVKRVVMTSAFGAAGMGYTAARNDYIFTEKDWSYLAPGTKLNAYYKSKTLAEKSAWEFISQEGEKLELTTILPVAVMGPVLGKKASGCNQIVSMMFSGHIPVFFDLYFPVIDVRDLAEAHILALETHNAAGERFIISNEHSLSMKQIGMILKNHFGEVAKKVPNRTIPSFILKFAALFNSMARETATDLGINYKMSSSNAHKALCWKPKYSVEETIIATGKSIIEKNILE
jgi:nucleoside-diphosphate-sugar epimerase